jgi:hypothetical protein
VTRLPVVILSAAARHVRALQSKELRLFFTALVLSFVPVEETGHLNKL